MSQKESPLKGARTIRAKHYTIRPSPPWGDGEIYNLCEYGIPPFLHSASVERVPDMSNCAACIDVYLEISRALD